MSCLILAGLSSCARPDAERPSPRSRDTAAAATLTADPERLDLGLLAPHAVVEGRVMIRNETDRSVTITTIDAPCDCTTPGWTLPRTLGPGEAAPLDIQLDLGHLRNGGAATPPTVPRTLERSLTLRTSDREDLEVALEATVQSRWMVQPPAVNFPILLPGTGGTMQLVVASADGTGVEGLEVHAEEHEIPLVASKRETADGLVIDLTWGPFPEPGSYETRLTIQPADAGEPALVVPLTATVRGLVTVNPPSIETEHAPATRPIEVTFVVGRRDERPIRVTRATSGDPTRIRLTIRPPQPHVPEARVHAVIITPPHPRRLQDEIVLHADAMDEPLRIPVDVRARAPSRPD